ncbi:MAG TPA: hypothetical protein VK181_23070, partial [Rhizobium sp.]|nr:hypothetical protein [Rhizobium sp.]
MALSTEQAPAGQLKRPHFHWVWKPAGQPNASWRWQLFGYYWRETPRRLNLVFSFRGLLLWTASLSFAAYLIGAAVLVTLWSRNPYNQVGYLDVVLPTRWSDLRALRGKGMIEEGLAEIKAKRYATGMLSLMRGVAMCPQSGTGRLQLAGIFASIGQVHRAKQLMIDGLAFGPPSRAYGEFAFRLTSYLEDYDAMLGIAEVIQLRASDQFAREALKWHALALEKLHRFEDLNALRERTKQRGFNTDVEQSWARAQLARGNPAAGLEEILHAPSHFGLPGERMQLQLDLAVAARDSERAQATVAEWLKIDPYGPLPRVREIVASIRLEQKDTAKEKIKVFFLHYASDLPAVVLLFRSLVELEDAQWLKTAYAE